MDKASSNGNRGTGRPRRGERPDIDWKAVDKLLVYGERVKDARTDTSILKFPSYRELGRRFKISSTMIGRYARKHNCKQRREDFLRREQAVYETKLTEMLASARALDTADMISVLDEYIRQFGEAVAARQIAVGSLADLNTAARLREFLLGNADSRREVNGTLTIQAIQAQHKRFGTDRTLPLVAAGVEPPRDLTGEVISAEPVTIEGVAEPVESEPESVATSGQ